MEQRAERFSPGPLSAALPIAVSHLPVACSVSGFGTPAIPGTVR